MTKTPTLRICSYSPQEYHDGVIRDNTTTANDIITVPSAYDDQTHKNLLKEIYTCNEKNKGKLLIPWHKNTHLIANDRLKGGRWKDECPIFNSLIDDMCNSFNVTPNATRINIYKGGDEPDYKPFHHDRAAFTPGLSQNITIGLSFGATREIAFKHAKYKKSVESKWKFFPKHVPQTIISFPCRNGSIYSFSRDVNCEFQHGVLWGTCKEDRISIIVWGTKYDLDVSQSKISKSQIPSKRELK